MERKFEERKLNLMDMFWAVLQKWRVVLVGALIFSVLAGAFSYYQSVKAIEAMQDGQEKVTLEDITLDESEEANVELYLEYKDLFEKQSTYNQTSPLMNFDANALCLYSLSYYVDNKYEVTYPIIDKRDNTEILVQRYVSVLRSEEMVNEIEKIFGTTEGFDMERIDLTNEYGELRQTQSDDGLLNISIYGKDETECTEIANLVKKQIENSYSSISAALGEHQLVVMHDSCKTVVNDNLLIYQRANVERLYDYDKKVSEVEAKLTNTGERYIELKDELKNPSEETVEEDVIGEPEISKKMVVLGLIAGIVLSICFNIMNYLLSQKIRMSDEIESMYGVNVLARMDVGSLKKKKLLDGLDRFWGKCRYSGVQVLQEDAGLNMIVSKIKIASKQKQIEEFFVTGTNFGEKEIAIIKDVQKELKKCNIAISYGESIRTCAQTLENASSIGNIIMVETVDKSKYMDIYKEMMLHEQQGSTIFGMIVVGC